MYQEKDIAFHKIFNRYVKERVINQVIIFFLKISWAKSWSLVVYNMESYQHMTFINNK